MKNMKNLLIAVTLCSVLASCTKTTERFILTGTVKNKSEKPVVSATIQLVGTTNLTATSGPNGEFTFQEAESGNYQVTVNATGYTQLNQSVSLTSAQTLTLKIDGPVNINGTVVDSQSATGLGGATVSFYSGLTSAPATGVPSDLVATTTSTGSYNVSGAPTGSFLGVIEVSGNYSRTFGPITFTAGGTVTIPPQVSVTKVTSGQFRAVLTWGINPIELDTHVTGPVSAGSSTRFHMYWSALLANATVTLDTDDKQTPGPETTTFKNLVTGTYRYSVYNYSDALTTGALGIFNSPAVVELYDVNGLVQKYTAPTASSGSGNTWKVFQINVSSSIGSSPSVIGTYSQVTNESDGTQFRVGSSKVGEKFKVEDF